MRNGARAENSDSEALIQQFEKDFGNARAAYLSLRYTGPAPTRPAAAPTQRIRPVIGGLALACSLFLISVLFLFNGGEGAPPHSRYPVLRMSKVKAPLPPAVGLKLAFSSLTRPTKTTASLGRFNMPARPTLSDPNGQQSPT